MQLGAEIDQIDVTPTWAGILPTLLVILEHATTEVGRKAATDELKRMAKLADLYVARHKPTPKAEEPPWTNKPDK